ncbi:MAG: DUF116 domain-containing protein [Deltaproteobacteria bacterium]|jgi:hypothetical protein|nr:DUF116 domain-containing protein [Deltaproteobacteria bacterium]
MTQPSARGEPARLRAITPSGLSGGGPFGRVPGQVYPEGARKRLFIGLAVGSSLLICLLLLLGWVVPFVGFANIHPALPYVTGVLLSLALALILFATLTLVVHVLRGRPFLGSQYFRSVSVRFFLPLMELVGRLRGIAPEDVRLSFIKVNNELLLTDGKRYAPEQILILLPHCIQRSTCDLRLSHDVNHCRRCGLCPFGELLTLRDKYGVRLVVATGGTIARRLVVELRPRFILAVACERDLSSGIQDAYPLPVFGLLNERPNGPCFDTLVSLPLIESALLRFISEERLPAPSTITSGAGDAP